MLSRSHGAGRDFERSSCASPFLKFLTATLPLIITVNGEPGDYVVPTVLAVGTVLAMQMHSIVEKRSNFLLLTCVGLEDQRNPEKKGRKQ